MSPSSLLVLPLPAPFSLSALGAGEKQTPMAEEEEEDPAAPKCSGHKPPRPKRRWRVLVVRDSLLRGTEASIADLTCPRRHAACLETVSKELQKDQYF